MINGPRETGRYYCKANGGIRLAFLASVDTSHIIATALPITRAVDYLQRVLLVGELLAFVTENTRAVKCATFAGRNASPPQARQSVPVF